MIPETFAALLAFVGFVAPGLVFEILRERRRPLIEETAFREASRVALTSLLFTIMALLGLVAIRQVAGTNLADPGEWVRQGNTYVQYNLGLVATTLLLELALALGLAVVVDWLFRQSVPGQIVSGSIWYQLFRRRCPKGATPWVHLRLKDETEIWGYVGDYTPDRKLENRELTLFGPKLKYQPKDKDAQPLTPSWSSVSVRGDEISWMKVTYVADDSPPDRFVILPSRQPMAVWWRRLAARGRRQ
jgi:hypothetical protein